MKMTQQAWNLDPNSHANMCDTLHAQLAKITADQCTTHLVLQCWQLWSTQETQSIRFLWFPPGLSGCGAAAPPWCGLQPGHVRCCGGWWKARPYLHWTEAEDTEITTDNWDHFNKTVVKILYKKERQTSLFTTIWYHWKVTQVFWFVYWQKIYC